MLRKTFNKSGDMMTPEEERRAEALAVQKLHGDNGPAFIAERIGALVLTGDMAGVKRWKEIAAKFDSLIQMNGPAN